jgi:hypothetical protein
MRRDACTYKVGLPGDENFERVYDQTGAQHMHVFFFAIYSEVIPTVESSDES